MADSTQRRTPLGRRRRWAFRVAAVLLGLSPFLLFEIGCIVFDWGRETDFDDPFGTFHSPSPLFVTDSEGQEYAIAPARLKYFAPDKFPAKKSPNTFRIFCLGGSTAQGRPFSTPTAFSTWLRLSLTAADDRRNWEVVNCGGVSYASYRLVPILKECLTHQPDLIILCTGHNEFLEERTYAPVKHASPVVAMLIRVFSQLRSFVLLRHTVDEWLSPQADNSSDKQPQFKSEVDALLDYRNGIDAYHRDEDWRAGVIAHYAHNVRQMLTLAEAADIPVILITPPSNLADSPPFKSQHRGDLTDAELTRWNELIEQARSHFRDDLDLAVSLLKQALEIDDQFAATHYELGKCLVAQGRYDEARAAFVRARDEDICPLRMLSEQEQALAEIAAETATAWIDAHALLERQTKTGILGGGHLVDHIHPDFDGHQEIADALLTEMIAQGFLTPSADWKPKRDAAYEEHLGSLDDLYHLRGNRTLGNLRAWSQGRADGPDITTRKGSDD